MKPVHFKRAKGPFLFKIALGLLTNLRSFQLGRNAILTAKKEAPGHEVDERYVAVKKPSEDAVAREDEIDDKKSR